MSNASVAVLLCLAATPAFATTYYLDSTRGNDSGLGTTESAPWKSLAKISTTNFQPGDRILLHAGCVWNEQLKQECQAPPA